MTRQFLERGIGRPDQYITIRSGMEIEPFLKVYDKAAARRRLGIPDEAFVAAKIARIAPLKGHEDVLRAAALAYKSLSNLHLLFIGDGGLRGAMERLAGELGLGGAVTFTGLVPPDAIPELLGAADCLVHASYREGLPRAVVQGMLAGLPVIGYPLDGTPEVIEEGKTGFMVGPGDMDALAERILQLASDPGLRGRLGAAARERVRGEFSWQEMVKSIAALYDRLVGGKRP
jgi:glycosyltransferase involved in cell wall biosynthesis